MSGLSPTQLSLRHLREQGLEAAVVEHFNPHVRIRQDLFGVWDILAVGNRALTFVQCTSDSHLADRIKKITDNAVTPKLREAGAVLLAHGWRKKGARWQLREVDVS